MFFFPIQHFQMAESFLNRSLHLEYIYFGLLFLFNIMPLWCDKMPQMHSNTLICISFNVYSVNCDDSTFSFHNWISLSEEGAPTRRECLASVYVSVLMWISGRGRGSWLFILWSFIFLFFSCDSYTPFRQKHSQQLWSYRLYAYFH